MTALVLALLFLTNGLVPTESASIAKCAPATFAVEYERSSAVFVGEVIKQEKIGDERVFVFEVSRFWKGVDSREIKVNVNESRMFQAFFEEGKTYLVFAKGDDAGNFYDGRCSHSAEVGGYSSTLKDDLEKLGKAKTCIDLKDNKKNEK